MAIARDVRLDRILIVFDAAGGVAGAHKEGVETLRDGDTVVSVRAVGPDPLSGTELASLFPASAELVAQVSKLQTSLTAAITDRDTAQTALAGVQAELDKAKGGTDVPLWAARAAIREAGLFDAIDSAVTTAKTSNPVLWEAWNMGNVLSPTSQFVTTLASQFGLSAAHVAGLFARAAEISSASQ